MRSRLQRKYSMHCTDFRKTHNYLLLPKTGDKYGKYAENFVQIFDTEFHPNPTMNVESTNGNFFTSEVKCGFCCVDFHATHIRLILFLDVFCIRLCPNNGRKMQELRVKLCLFPYVNYGFLQIFAKLETTVRYYAELLYRISPKLVKTCEKYGQKSIYVLR